MLLTGRETLRRQFVDRLHLELSFELAVTLLGAIAQPFHHLDVPVGDLQQRRFLGGGVLPLVSRLPATIGEPTLPGDPNPVPLDDLDANRRAKRRQRLGGGPIGAGLSLIGEPCRFTRRLGGAQVFTARCIGLRTAPLQDAFAAKLEALHAPAPCVTCCSAPTASAYRHVVSDA